jgi:hypothetical protein
MQAVNKPVISCARHKLDCLTGNEDEPGLKLTRPTACAEMARRLVSRRQSYLDAFTFRFNCRGTRPAACRPLLRIAARRQPVTYKMLIAKRETG